MTVFNHQNEIRSFAFHLNTNRFANNIPCEPANNRSEVQTTKKIIFAITSVLLGARPDDIQALRTEMGLFTRRKVDSDPDNDITKSDTTNGRTGISRFGRTYKPADVPSSRSGAAGQGGLRAIRFVQLLLAILILGLVAYAVNIFSSTFVSEDPAGDVDGLLN